MYRKEYIHEQFRNINIDLNEKQVCQFYDYYEMLIEKNKVVNLTAITEYEDVIIKHFVDSVLISNIEYVDKVLKGNDNADNSSINNLKNNSKSYGERIEVIDVGTGAGFPGIPLKIVYPNINLTLLDSLNKRIIFLNEIVEKLSLENVKCIHGRAEDYGVDKNYREKYDICVSRAVANLSTLSEYCVPFVKVGGIFISYKSSDILEEIEKSKSALKKLNCNIKEIIDKDLIVHKDKDNDNDDTDIEIKYERKFVIINKKNRLDKKYPRKAGVPSKTPL